MKNAFRVTGLGIGLLLCAGVVMPAIAGDSDDVIARVGDEVIRFHDLDMTIDSSAMIGMPIPSRGTKERTNLRLTLLDREISADLLYLDALKKGVDSNPVYRHDLQRYSDTILAAMYKEKNLVGELPVSDEEIRDYFEKNIAKGTPFTQDVHMAIEARIRKERFKERLATLRERLRKDVKVRVFEDQLDAAGDMDRAASAVLADADGVRVTWGDARQELELAKGPGDRRERLEKQIDTLLMISKAKAAGLEQDHGYQRRLKEFTKSSLVNIYRTQVEEQLNPSEEELKTYFREHRQNVVVPEARKIQMLVVKTQKEAAEIRKKIESGTITFYQAAQAYSIDPNAKMNLGELGWVEQGTGFPGLDQATFALKTGDIGGPVESPTGWHLVKVLDVREGKYTDLDDRETWNRARRLLLHEKLNHYVTQLRETAFPVQVFDDVFSRLTQAEIASKPADKPAMPAISGK